MTFLQPYLLWLLPLAALPIVIHLLNRMRFRTVHWAATKFLFSANRASTRYARLRQLLLLACRVLALLAMLLAVARPLAGGWAGWMLSSSPDVVLILLDRSASMETKDAATGVSRRERGLREVAEAAATYGTRTRCVLIENVLRTPQEVAQPDLLPKLPMAGATDTASDMPAMFDAAAAWLEHNRVALAEVWIVSDLQRSNWQPGSARWKTIAGRIAALPETVRVRLLELSGKAAPNNSVTLVSALSQNANEAAPSIDLVFDIQKSDTAAGTIPVSMTLDGSRSHLDLAVNGSSTRVHHSLPLNAGHDSGYGSIDLAPDGNDRDNSAYFVYSPAPPMRVAVAGADDSSKRCLIAAGDPFPDDPKYSCDVIDQPSANTDWDKYASVIWAAPIPTGESAKKLDTYIRAGGAVIFFPTPAADGNAFATASWGEEKDAAAQSFRVAHWDQQDGPLADSASGTRLAVGALQVTKYKTIASGGDIRAELGNNSAFLTEKVLGKGRVYFCATLPRADWSSLGDGRVLVPMLQRIAQQGARRFAAGQYLNAGDETLIDNPQGWLSLSGSGDARFDAGVYRNGGRFIAVNRPQDEDDPERISAATARGLFAPLATFLFEEKGTETQNLQGEIWRGLLFAMLLLLVGESYLSLPPKATASAEKSASQTSRQKAEMAST